MINLFKNCADKRVLFICKHRNSYGNSISYGTGLFNSARFVSDMLVENGYESKVIEVVDNNKIDKEVYDYKPQYVIIEALWVVPSKFEVLTKLHPNVTWIIRIHSEIPFLANEGVAIEWIMGYLDYDNVILSFNSKRTNNEFVELMSDKYKKDMTKRVVYLPNYYKLEEQYQYLRDNKNKCADDSCDNNIINVSCFGAIRPLKNHLLQATAAINFANRIGKELRFHINSKRLENRGEPVLKNLRNLFAHSPHKLIEHDWLNREEFLTLISKMDIGMQVSFSETFNIVSADMVALNIPVVGSHEIEWLNPLFKVKTTSSKMISFKLWIATILAKFQLQFLNKIGLFIDRMKAKFVWLNYLNKK